MFDVELDRPATVIQGKLAQLREQRSLKYAPPKRMNRYLPSQFLMDSSLAVQSQQMDLQVSPQLQLKMEQEEAPHKSPQLASSAADDEKGASVYFIEEGELEIDDINRHECMVRALKGAISFKMMFISPNILK